MRPVIGLTSSLILPEGSAVAERFGVTALYCRAVAEAGGAPLLIPGLGDAACAAIVLPHLDGLLLTGGPDIHPGRYGQEIHQGCERIDEARDATELALIAGARHNGMPIFGICRGIQMLNVGFGGTLIQDVEQERPGSLPHRTQVSAPSERSHHLEIEPGSLLARAIGTGDIAANSLHHQAVDRVAQGFQVSARAADGLVEAIEDTEHPFRLAVQCHPEFLFQREPRWLALFGAFVQAAIGWRSGALAGAR